MSKKPVVKKSVKTVKTGTAVQPENPPLQAAPRTVNKTMEKILIAVLIATVLFMAYQGIDYYTGWGNPGKVIKRMLDEAEKNSIYKRYAQAIQKYDYIISKWGSDPKYSEDIRQTKLNLAKAYKDSEQYLQAIDMYKSLTQEYSSTNRDMYAWLLLELADSYNSILNTDQAITVYRQVVGEFKGTDWSAEALFGIAEAYRSKKDYKNAITYYDLIVEKYQKGFLSAEALTNKGRIMEDTGRIKDAVRIYEKVVKDFPDIVTEFAKTRLGVLSGKEVK
jgi:tetratricopeptide (TPR) repeat protein